MLRAFFLVAAIFAGLSFFAPSGEGAEKFPRPVGAVNDFANVIPNAYRQRMDALAREVLAKTGTSIVVATVPTIGDNDPADYANRLYQSWGIGKKGEDKGVLIFLALKERQVRIETGYGVEGILPDGRVGAILDRDVVPFLRKGEYGRGLLNAMLDVAAVVAEDAKASIGEKRVVPQPHRGMEGLPREKGISWAGTLVSLLILVVLFGLLLATPQGRSLLPLILLMFLGGGRGGGGFGAFGGGGFGGFGGGSSGGGGAGRGF
ncbi:MAG: TPM domain-containing protein [Syntrophobacterales bacterium]|nr:TPM domain-containing protein [Syntrophobacterales bacterium]